MKRGKPLERRTPLASRTPLARAAQPRTGTTREPAARPARPRPASTGPSAAVRHGVYGRDSWQCALAGLLDEPCVHGLSLQHRVPRQAGGSRNVEWINEPANLVTVCGDGTVGHHAWLERNRTEAERLGLIVRRRRNADSTWQALIATPVYVRGTWYLPAGDGWRATLPAWKESNDG